MKKKLLAIAVIFTLIFSQLSISVLADDGDENDHDYSGCSLSIDYMGNDSSYLYSNEEARTIAVIPENMDGLSYTYEYAVTIGEEQIPVDPEMYSFDPDAGILTLYGSAIWNEQVAQALDDNDRFIYFTISAKDTEDNEIAWTSADFYLREPFAEVSYSINPTMGAGIESYIEDNATAYVCTAGIDGDYIDLKIDTVRFTDSSFGSFQQDDEGYWYTVPAKTGKATLELTFYNPADPDDGIDYSCTRDVTVVNSIETIGVWYDNEDGIFPGDDVVLNISYPGEYEFPEDVTFDWSLSQEAEDAGCKITYDPSVDKYKATLHIPDGCTIWINVTLTAYQGTEILDQSINTVDVSNTFYRIFTGDIDEYLALDEEVTFTPVIKKKTTEDKEYRIVDGAVFNVFMTDEDSQPVTINDYAEITDNGDGSYTIKRLSTDYFSVCIEAYKDDEYLQTYYIYFYDTSAGYNVWLTDPDNYDLYNGGTKTLTLSTDEGITSDSRFSLEYSLHKMTSESDWETLDNTGNKYFEVDGNSIILNGTSIWDEVKDGYIENEDYPLLHRLLFTVDLRYRGNVVASDYCDVVATTARTDYLIKDTEVLAGSSLDIEFSGGYRWDAEHPDAEQFDYEITSITSADPATAAVVKEEYGGWTLVGKKPGSTVLTYKVKAEDTGETATITANVFVLEDSYWIDLDNDYFKGLPGDSFTMTATGGHTNYKTGDLKDFTYKWTIDDGSEYASITANGNKATLSLNQNIPDEDLESSRYVTGSVAMVINGKEVYKETFEVSVERHLYVVKPLPEDINKYLAVGKTLTITPKVTKREYKNGEVADTPVTDFVWEVNVDTPEDLNVTKDGATVLPDTYYTGSFIVKRLSHYWGAFFFDLYIPDEESDDYQLIYWQQYTLEDLDWIANASISNIKSKTYTGKALTQSPTVDFEGVKLALNKDYKVTYKNNTSAGTATVEITGIGRFYGKVTKTFKILKAANTLKVTAKKPSIKYSKLKKKNQTIAASKAYTVSKPLGKVTYKLAGVTASKYKKYFKVNSKTGKITVKKKLKKGTYKVKVKVTAAGDKNHNALTKTVTVQVKVK